MKAKKKNSLKKRLLDGTLHKNTGLNLCLSIISQAFYPFSYTFSYHLIKAIG